MTVSAQTTVNSSTGNGVTTVFPYAFKILRDADLEVLVDGVVKALTTDYTVSGAGAGSGGDVTFLSAPAGGSLVVRRRNMQFLRAADYQYQGDLPNTVLNPDLDAPVMMAQQLQEQVSRGMRGAAGETWDELPAASDRLDMFPVFNATTGELELSSVTLTQIDSAIAAAYAAGSTADAVTFLQSGTGAISRSVQSKLRELKSLQDFGAVGDGTADDTVSVQKGFTWLAGASYRKLVGVPGDVYKLTASITAGGAFSYWAFDGQGCGIKNAINATPANAMFAITASDWFEFGGFTQSVDAAATKGHGISIVGSGLTPGFIKLHDIGFNSLVGSGKDYSGASMNACAIYCYGVGKIDIDNVFAQDGTRGLYFDTVDKVTIARSVIDDCTNQGIYFNNVVNIDIGQGTIINGCGTTGQGALEFTQVTSLSFHNSRIKGGAGSAVLSSGTTYTQRRVSIRDNHIEVYSNTDDSIKLLSNCVAPIIEGNDIQIVPSGTNAYTTAISIADFAGGGGYGGRIIGNNVRLGGATTLTNGIKLSGATNNLRAYLIESNTIGSIASADVGGASVITNAINLSGLGGDNKVRSNTISASGAQTITNGIVIESGQTNAELNGNRFDGTVTNRYVDNGIQTVSDQTGTFTPVVFGGTVAGAAAAYSVQVGRYVRVGKLVHATINVAWSGHTGTGDLRISGLPNPIISTTNDNPVGTCLADALTFAGQLVVYGGAGTSTLRLASQATGAAVSFVAMDAAASLFITIMYEVA